MEGKNYYQPESCRFGGEYFIKEDSPDADSAYTRVEFISYRPHPGEVVVKQGETLLVVHRTFLYACRRANGITGESGSALPEI